MAWSWFMELFKKHTIPEISEIPILDGEEWDLSFAIDQYQKTLNTNKINQANTTTDADINEAEWFCGTRPTCPGKSKIIGESLKKYRFAIQFFINKSIDYKSQVPHPFRRDNPLSSEIETKTLRDYVLHQRTDWVHWEKISVQDECSEKKSNTR